MPRIPIDNLGTVGLVKDIYAHETPPEAWSYLRNARMGPYGAEKFLGHVKALGTDSAGWAVTPYWLFYAPVAGGGDYWVGAGTAKVYCRTAISPYTETNITRQTASVDVNYSATQDIKWNGGMYGGLLVLNNGVDVPQVWSPVAAATKLQNLTAFGSSPWNSNHKCLVMRPFGRFLVAINITKSSVRYPQLIKWGAPADPGNTPSTWDEADTANDAGEYPLMDADGDLLDMLTLRNQNFLYTQGEVWNMSLTQSGGVFRFERLFQNNGALATNCIAKFKKTTEMHAVLGADDVYAHNGQTVTSVITPQMRKWLFQQLDPNYYGRSFAVANPTFSEVWFCFPELGAEQPTLALVWNWDTGAIGFRDLLKESSGDTRTTAGTQGTPCIASGFIEDVVAEPWDGDSAVWDADTTVWDSRTANPATPRLLMADRSAGIRTFLLDSSSQFDGTNFTWQGERVGLSIVGRDRNGQPKNDSEFVKLLTELWPRFEAASGTQITFAVGAQMEQTQGVSWSGDYTYTVGQEPAFIPVFNSGRYISIRFSYTGSSAARFMGYDLNVEVSGTL